MNAAGLLMIIALLSSHVVGTANTQVSSDTASSITYVVTGSGGTLA